MVQSRIMPVDAVVLGAHFVTQLQTLVSRRIAPLHAAWCRLVNFEAINPFNVVADTVKINAGTVRAFDESSTRPN